MTELSTTHTSVVTEDQIDHLGHMNVRYYGVNARAATYSVLAGLGIGGSLDVFDMYTRHHREQLLGTELEVRSGVLGVDTESIRIYHELANAVTGELAATFVYRVRTDTPFDHLDAVDLPAHGAPRSIDLDAVGSMPSLDTVRSLDLAMRAPRTITTDDTGGGDTVSPHFVPMLIWGGTSPDGSEQSLTMIGPNGERMGWATMETRIGIRRLPTVGTQIQAFGATTAMADKTTQMSMWSFDVDSGELLVSFEVVSVLFNIDERRAMSIPDHLRAEHAAHFHPEISTG